MPAADREQARRALRARRRQCDLTAVESGDRALFARVGALVNGLDRPKRVVGVYWPMAGEPDLRPELPDWHNAGWQLALPCVDSVHRPLRFCAYTPGDVMVEGLLGTSQPRVCAELTPDVLLIPCLGFDARAYRLGYGGGFYDRTLAAFAQSGHRPVSVGVARDDAEMSGFQDQPHDWPLDWIVTDLRCLAGGRRRL